MKVLFVLTLGLLLNFTVNATIRRVGFTDVPAVAGIDYVSFYLAYQAAITGDTIYVFPGKTISQNGWPTSFGRAEIRKRLVIVGKGNLLDSSSNPKGNFGYQATKGLSYFGAVSNEFSRGIYFFDGAQGSVIMGFDGQGSYIVPFTDNITIKGNFNLQIWLANLNISNLTIEKNYRVWFSGEHSKNFTWTGVTIRNNFIYQFALPDHSYSGTIVNNTFAYDQTGAANGGDAALSYFGGTCGNCIPDHYIYLRDGTWLFESNLIIWYSNSNTLNNVSYFVITGASLSTLNYNVALQSTNFTSWPGNATGNVFLPSAQVSSIFEAFPAIGTSSADKRYQLKSGSPASQANRPGSTSDAGMFGGPNSYKLSTIPSIPTIYSISSPQGNSPTGNTIQVIISTRSNN